MADEQNQENTVVNQGTTIDNLPGLDGLTPAAKRAFIDASFVPIRGTISGEQTTRKVLGSDLVAVPVPDPTDVGAPAATGDVLTFDGDDIVWAAPQGGGMAFPDTLDISTWSIPGDPDYTKAVGENSIYCESTGLGQDGKLQLQWYWKVGANDSAGFRGTPMSGAFG